MGLHKRTTQDVDHTGSGVFSDNRVDERVASTVANVAGLTDLVGLFLVGIVVVVVPLLLFVLAGHAVCGGTITDDSAVDEQTVQNPKQVNPAVCRIKLVTIDDSSITVLGLDTVDFAVAYPT